MRVFLCLLLLGLLASLVYSQETTSQLIYNTLGGKNQAPQKDQDLKSSLKRLRNSGKTGKTVKQTEVGIAKPKIVTAFKAKNDGEFLQLTPSVMSITKMAFYHRAASSDARIASPYEAKMPFSLKASSSAQKQQELLRAKQYNFDQFMKFTKLMTAIGDCSLQLDKIIDSDVPNAQRSKKVVALYVKHVRGISNQISSSNLRSKYKQMLSCEYCLLGSRLKEQMKKSPSGSNLPAIKSSKERKEQEEKKEEEDEQSQYIFMVAPKVAAPPKCFLRTDKGSQCQSNSKCQADKNECQQVTKMIDSGIQDIIRKSEQLASIKFQGGMPEQEEDRRLDLMGKFEDQLKALGKLYRQISSTIKCRQHSPGYHGPDIDFTSMMKRAKNAVSRILPD